METFQWLERLKKSIQSDFQDFEKRCSEANEKISCLETENGVLKKLNKALQTENARQKEQLAKLVKKVTHREEKLRRKEEELDNKEKWWNRYRKMSETRFRAMKKNGRFPPSILESYVNKDMTELMNDISEDGSCANEIEQSLKSKNLSTSKYKKKVRYDSIHKSSLGEDTEKNSNALSNKMNEKQEISLTEEHDKLNNSTMLYNFPAKGLKLGEKVLPPEILIPETEYDALSEAPGDEMSYSLGVPSAASTPVATANTPLFNDDDDDDDDDDDGNGFLGGTSQLPNSAACSRSVFASKDQVNNLPRSDSQFPVDLSHTQPPSPTVPSRSRSLQQDLSTTLDCSVSLLPHGLKNEKQENKNNLRNTAVAEILNDKKSVKSCQSLQVNKQGGRKNSQTNLKQTTIDSNVPRTKVGPKKESNAISVAKRKREMSEEVEEITLCGKKNKKNLEQTNDAVFKVPSQLPPSTPEVVLLNFSSNDKSARKSSNTMLGGSNESPKLYTSCVDLFADVEEKISPVRPPSVVDFCKAKEEIPFAFGEKENTVAQAEGSDVQNGDMQLKNNCPIRNSPEPGYKYVEVVRGRDARAKLNGYPCRECQQYFEKLDLPQEELQKRLKQCSRHRSKFSPPPSTPPGFWDLSFPSTQEYMDKGYLKTACQAPTMRRTRKLIAK